MTQEELGLKLDVPGESLNVIRAMRAQLGNYGFTLVDAKIRHHSGACLYIRKAPETVGKDGVTYSGHVIQRVPLEEVS